MDAGTVYSSIRIRLEQLDSDLKGVYARLDQMESKIKTQTSGATESASKSFNAMSIFGVAAFLGIGNAIKSTIDTFSSFEQSMANVASVAGATDSEFLALSDAAEKAGETTRYTASQAADAMYYLASAGYSASQSIDALDGVLALAQATGSDLASTSSTMAAAISQFGLQADDAGRVANVFAAAITSSQANMDKLTTGLRQVGPVAGTLGISLEEVTANLDALFNKGFQGEQAGTALRSILLDLVDPSSAVVAALKAQGLEYDKVNPRVVGLSGAFENMAKAGVDLTTVFNKVSASEALALIDVAKQSSGNLQDLQDKITGTNKAAEAMATQNNTTAGSFDIMKSKAQGASISFGKEFEPAIRTVYDSLGSFFEIIKGLPGPIKALIGVLSGVAVVLGGVAAAAGVLGISLAPIAPFILPIAAAITVLGTAATITAKSISGQNNVTEQLNLTTKNLVETSNQYKDVQKELSDNADTLTQSEKDVLEGRKKLLALKIEQQLETLAKQYTKANSAIDSQAKGLEKTKDRMANFNAEIEAYRKNLEEVGWSQGDINDRIEEYRQKKYAELLSKERTQTERVTKANTDMESSINSIAKAVADGTIDISGYKNVNAELYERIMKQVEALKAQNTEVKTASKSVSTGVVELKNWQKALKDALSVSDVSSGKNAVSEYIENMRVSLARSLEAAKATGKDTSSVYQDYIDKINTAIGSLIESGEYLADETTIKSLQDYRDSLGGIADKYGDVANATSDLINWNQLLADSEASVVEGMVSAVEAATAAVVQGKDGWAAYGSAALLALAAVIEGIAREITVLAAASIAKYGIFNPIGWQESAWDLVQASLAYAAAGVVKGLAANMATGGIVSPSGGGTIVRVAENGSAEGVFNAGQSGKALIDAFTSAMVKNMGNSGNQTIILTMDGKEMTRVVTRRQMNKDY